MSPNGTGFNRLDLNWNQTFILLDVMEMDLIPSEGWHLRPAASGVCHVKCC